MARKAISKRVRFEVFKRDGFTCQYCGGHPPTVILQIDHVHPVAEGGTNDEENLVTACDACNLGKGARLLSSVPESVQSRVEILQEREDQVRGYRQLLDEREARDTEDSLLCLRALFPESTTDVDFTLKDRLTTKHFVAQLGFHEVKRAAEVAFTKQPRDWYNRFRYFCGICWGKLRATGGAR